ncbi:tRNA (adenosine(37)-N6)-threonylcarbamoyltransferase complex ATPase subunit type 1 TsaE [Mycoplasma sp. CSL10137]|uniref:tRNA (adenosine(37)-N6)-threonylcarbamoyltransferase complex ATPase subunit type 1 TsaE n=2 Tax=Mycoplasma TaxID=2093 RepID=UPI00197C3523|nr:MULTISPECIES: tRNA (adenosine(37)-N6)-threonylcarbamoyltransferase complex ATPase subunit type 1 TsaE [unclassified Mycoplasma]MBN4083471.1 tRNA (adenosine(37)-N6)-threonylcarbamoyltransferase complex ATPase subunit type 1 TsaE [Mycoplasma sp. CSL10137]MBN4084598.1 tRNA (adenosine(37)-N6)-threonylcarbamoyltransferase complex ATPase subunit type 1 TsaE [Mycoplasma sp. CSL10166]MBU4693076.1 tRNA (adenosine(37)-N6)-threonylcarbamoyltransferase complex ATPase subunit type 1 TsaE [Mycoplasma sp. C
MMKIKINDLQELDDFIRKILPLIKKNKILLLYGDLGSGKTTFVKLLAKQLEIKDKITSPSFNYMKTYNGLIHIDLYNYKGDLDEFVDYFEDNIVAIEWSEYLKYQFDNFTKIKISIINDQRFIELEEK